MNLFNQLFENFPEDLQSTLISSGITLIIFLLGWIFRVLYERSMVKFKLANDFKYEQKKKIKDGLAMLRIPLLDSAEELNYRLWNFSENIEEGWHNIPEAEWNLPENYYLRSWVYRLLIFLTWVLETEKSIRHFDSTIASKKDVTYIKFIKTFKNFFCDKVLIETLNYGNNQVSHHFYKNDLDSYCSYITNGKDILSYQQFQEKLKEDYSPIRKVIIYINQVLNKDDDKGLNVLRVFHLVLMKFLNQYGHAYQRTSFLKIWRLIAKKYYAIRIRKSFLFFLRRNKILGKIWIFAALLKIHSPSVLKKELKNGSGR